MPLINCKRTARIKMDGIMCKIAGQGEPAFEVYRAAHNAFIDTLVALSSVTLEAMKPLILIDQVVIDNFVKPPLEATITVAEQTSKAIKVPFRVMAGLFGPECKGYAAGFTNAMNSVCNFLTKDYNKLRNQADELLDWTESRQELIKGLEAMVDALADFRIDEPYEEFVRTRCQTT